jgi:hypothetical protein
MKCRIKEEEEAVHQEDHILHLISMNMKCNK